MEYLRYSGQFLSHESIVWKVDIYQEADEPFSSIGILRFPADSPLVIEWAHTDKEEVICGSTASLTIVSPGDRTYEDLYIILPGSIRLEVLRNGLLYWSGALDPEFYEEPYSAFDEYEVKLTFSDFGILDRLKYDLTGTRTLENILQYALRRSKIQYGELNQDYLSTYLEEGGTRATLDKISVRSDNFYDEDGEACTLYEVIEGMLQPLALRLIQKNGKIWVYDLNGLYLHGITKGILWKSDDQIMGVDKVINNVKITFSPYSDGKLLGQEIKYTGEYSADYVNIRGEGAPPGVYYYAFYVDYGWRVENDVDYENLSFAIFPDSRKGTGLAEMNLCTYFHILPLLGAQPADGVAFTMSTGVHIAGGTPNQFPQKPWQKPEQVIMRTYRTFIPKLSEKDSEKYYIRLSMDMLLDARYNPFTEGSSDNEKSNYELLDYRFNYVQIPVTVTLYDDDGNALMHYSNADIAKRTDLRGALSYKTKGEWLDGAASYQSCWLEWYDPADRHEKSGIQGWKKNRHNIGLSLEDIYRSFQRLEEGQYIPYPKKNGYLEVCIYAGVWVYEWTKGKIKEAPDDWYQKIRWLLYKAPQLDMVRKNIIHDNAENDDIEYTGVINESAKEGISLDTICGTMTDTSPTGKGVLFRTEDGIQIKELTRAGRTTQAEQLLIGTLYSQYAERKTLLTGTAGILDGDLAVCSESCQDVKRFICLSDKQDVIEDESRLEIVELRPDEYSSDKD